ncbi:MAG: adenine nucleotide alpha hydrolase family protein [Chloroflexi bacterium]|nr:adenine nucleotide alpha hydrolase family protein [Chloroflexota bacterium]
MHCRKCHQNAVINMRHHKLALCGEHYADWFVAQTERAIEKYKMFSRDEAVLVAVSGGKDSLALWDVLLKLGYRADAMYMGLGINETVPYSDQSLEKTKKFLANVIARSEATKQSPSDMEIASQEPLAMTYTPTLHVIDIEETYGKTIPEIAREKTRGHGKPCAACGLTKRYVMNRLAAEKGYAVLATGHNLDDEVAVLMQNTLRWQTGYLARQAPVLPAMSNRFARKVKPFVRFYERETATYALVRGIDYIYDECPHAVGNLTNFYKTLLNQLEANSPGAKLSFYLEFLRARKEGLFDPFNQVASLHECDSCGQPTSAPGRCAFCRMWGIGADRADATILATEIPLAAELNEPTLAS